MLTQALVVLSVVFFVNAATEYMAVSAGKIERINLDDGSRVFINPFFYRFPNGTKDCVLNATKVAYHETLDIVFFPIACKNASLGGILRHQIRTNKTAQSDFFSNAVPVGLFVREDSIMFSAEDGTLFELDAYSLRLKHTYNVLRALGKPSGEMLYVDHRDELIYKVYGSGSNVTILDMSKIGGDLSQVVEKTTTMKCSINAIIRNPYDGKRVYAILGGKNITLIDTSFLTGAVEQNITLQIENFRGSTGNIPFIINHLAAKLIMFVQEVQTGRIFDVSIDLRFGFKLVKAIPINKTSLDFSFIERF